jgi:hypothetical protein
MKPLLDPQNWIPVKEAAFTLRVSRHTVARLCEEHDPVTRKPYIESWRPTPGTIFVSRQSLEQYCNATRSDPEFWSGRKQHCFAIRARRRHAPEKARPTRVTASLRNR